MYKTASYRGTPHVIVGTGKVGANPDVADGNHYSDEPTSRIASLCWPNAETAFSNGFWIPDRLLTPLEVIHNFTPVEVSMEEPAESTRDLVFKALQKGPIKIGPLATEINRPSAAIHSTLVSARRKGEVIFDEVENTWELVRA